MTGSFDNQNSVQPSVPNRAFSLRFCHSWFGLMHMLAIKFLILYVVPPGSNKWACTTTRNPYSCMTMILFVNEQWTKKDEPQSHSSGRLYGLSKHNLWLRFIVWIDCLREKCDDNPTIELSTFTSRWFDK